MKKASFITFLLLVIYQFGFSQVQYFAEISGALSTKSEYIGGFELGVRPIEQSLYFGVLGQTFKANRDKDQTSHALIAPKIYYCFPISQNVSIDPFAGGAYHFGGNENYRISEVGPILGSKFAVALKNSGYFFVEPSIILTSNRLYELGVGFGGIF